MASRPAIDWLPALVWARHYRLKDLRNDAIAAIVVAVMLIPQALGLALVAGVPAQAGLYAAMSGLTIYALFGSSRCLSVGPVAVLSLMTAAALSRLPLQTPAEYAAAALTLSFITGAILLLAGFFRLGFVANFIPRPVLVAFVTASAILIALSQMDLLFNVPVSGSNALAMFASLIANLTGAHLPTLALGLTAIAFLVICKLRLARLFLRLGFRRGAARSLSRAGPIALAALAILLSWQFNLEEVGVEVLGEIPSGLPAFTLPDFSPALLGSLFLSALPLAIVCYVESISVAQALAVRRRQTISPNQELTGLGAANLVTSFSGGMPVAGGFSRSLVNFEAGAATPAAGFYAAVIIALVVLFLTPVLYWLPRVCLAAVILVAVYALLDFSIFAKSWRHSRSDFFAVAITLIVTLTVGAEAGIGAGVLTAVLMHLYKTSRPHVAIVGRVPGTEHFRNVRHYQVETSDKILSVRIDEALYFPNTRYLESLLFRLVAERPGLKHVVLMCPAVNDIDLSALETLENINDVLADSGISLHLSEVKVPIMNILKGTRFFTRLSGRTYLSQNQAFEDLRGD
ncbi:MAG: sulfate permease [Gammaproteobacteria bacterium]|nr:sulfate permease [Gammaproteobacteria bacterium]MYG95920.1 sulfate permease [Gammaproteobacteria bacterium]